MFHPVNEININLSVTYFAHLSTAVSDYLVSILSALGIVEMGEVNSMLLHMYKCTVMLSHSIGFTMTLYLSIFFLYFLACEPSLYVFVQTKEGKNRTHLCYTEI